MFIFSEKQSLSRSVRKNVCRLEKSTPPPVVAVLTDMSYGSKYIFAPHVKIFEVDHLVLFDILSIYVGRVDGCGAELMVVV